MKKLFLSLFAVIGSFAAFGQDNAYVNFDPVSGSELSTLNTNIKVTLNTDASATTAVVQTIGGYGSIQYAPDPEIAIIEEVDGEKVINISLTSDLWGTPYFEMYYLQVMVVPMTDDMTPIETEDGDYVMGMATYTCTDTGDARLELTFPNQQNINNEEYTISQAYESGICTAYFSKEVNVDNATGSIVVIDNSGDILAYSDMEYLSAEWSDMDGLFKVDFTFTPNETFIESQVSEMDITIEGISYDGRELIIPEVVLFPASASNRAPQRRIKSKLANDMSVNVAGFTVFNIQGNLVKDNATEAEVNALPTGLYIVNGKKVLVK